MHESKKIHKNWLKNYKVEKVFTMVVYILKL